MDNGIQLYCVTHREYPNIPDTPLVSPILVGMEDVSGINLKCRDFIPEMSMMNRNWNELEAIYWIRHNCTAPIKGQFQYAKRLILEPQEIQHLLSTHKFISAYGKFSDTTIQEHYCTYHHIEDLILCGDIIKENYPDMFNRAWNITMNSSLILVGNCFIAKAEDYNECCDFLFDILKRFNSIKGFNRMEDIKSYYEGFPNNFDGVDYQSRVSGFLAERLFTFYNISKFGGFDKTALVPLSILPK